ncbi:hypothetical protein N1614_05630 [Adlercreutzia muris]|jgi:hypothetical protein|uniref:hypothetical protein n=1 Tax=Adlercreutzia muris TaxID=1796610 RepID=UPI0021D61346|nr:hypothetical protein [Adlercreutzia muris]MCU7584824.1 hypothetical protein [Adlercreutzia muris]
MARGNARRSMADYSVASHARGVAAGDERLERYHEYVGRHRAERRVWPGAAFIVEALLLLVFLAGSLAVLMDLNADADAAGAQSTDLMGALVLASNVAEEFAADPVALQEAYAADPAADQWFSCPLDVVESGSGILRAECTFATEPTEGGLLHRLTLTVWKERVLTDREQAADEGYIINDPEGAVFERWEEEPVYTVETARYVASAGTRPSLPSADGAGAAPTEGEVSHG